MYKRPFIGVAIAATLLPAFAIAGQTDWRTSLNFPNALSDTYLPASDKEPQPRATCLVHKVTKKRECHSREGWRQVAAKLDAQRGTAPHHGGQHPPAQR